MLKLDAVQAFVAIVEAGSISAAARRLGLSKSLISERLSDLETLLGVRLLHRTTRRLDLTEDGAVFLPRARSLVRDAETAVDEMASLRGDLAGSLRISGPVTFGVMHLGPALSSFLKTHPGMDVTLDLDDRLMDLTAGGHDAVIRHGPIQDAGLTAIRLATSRRRLVASEAWLAAHGEPRTLADLELCPAILYSNRATDWRFQGSDGPVVIHPRARLRVNNGLVMRDAAIAGLGVALLPSFILHGASESLRVLDVGAEAQGAEINLVFLKHQGASARLKALIAHLQTAFGAPPYWDV